ncbi:chromosomal replication initiator protein DnaA [Breznakiella homolactica]|uniref:Chromosomal replication initiator protein DnaA n=1 Tax=Breznakiella homolactica TaxID=2798577 RepID=A0A7T7XPC1_9SPIR|nr:chromosomal replication initiator protein DnaA [Breznakiella homolactica]QQO10016.1 chromosomal replication initiator protein DnaA [Breznakiella homolactica]
MADWDYEIFWTETIKHIKGELEEQEFAMWFNIEYLRSTERELIVAVPSSFYRDQVKQRYQSYIENKIRELTGKDLSIQFEVQSKKDPPKTPAAPEKTESLPEQKKPARETKSQKSAKQNHSQLRKDYIFDNYVIGDNNNFASNAAMAIARNPGDAYNPFLIYGGVGLGKTHLMQAIGNYIYENSDQKVIYITAESFTNEFIHAIKEGPSKAAAFKNKYRYADVLLIDDIHFLQKKYETQEELFHTFNALYDAKKQIVFTCDRPLSELKNFSDRLSNRFGKGLNVDLQPPDYETRFAILKMKTEARGVNIPDEVIALVSKNVSSNIRDLESALIKLIAYAELVGKPITVETAQQQLKDVFASPRQTNMSIETIQRVVADYFSLSHNDLKSKKRTQNIVFPRQLSMFIAREITEYSTTEVGQSFGGRDHTTVMHACQKIEERITADPSLESTIQTLIRMIKEYSAKS